MKVRGLYFLRTWHLIYIRETRALLDPHPHRAREPRGLTLDNGSNLERRLMRPRTRVNWLICTASSDNLRIKSGSSIRSACHFHWCIRLQFIFCPRVSARTRTLRISLFASAKSAMRTRSLICDSRDCLCLSLSLKSPIVVGKPLFSEETSS